MTAIAYRLTNSRITNLNFVVTTALAVLTALIIFTLDIRLVLALFVVPWFIFFFYKKPMILVCLWPLVSLLEVFFPWAPVRIGGFRILPMDPIYFFTVAVLGVRTVAQPKSVFNVLRENRYIAIFLAMVVLNVILYTPANGQSAIGEARKYYLLFSFPLLAVLSIRTIKDFRTVLIVMAVAALTVSIVAVYRAAALLTIVRILNAEATLILALVTFALLLCWINKVTLISVPIHAGLLGAFGLLAIGSGQRSVWLAIALGIVVLVFLYRQRISFMVKALILAGAFIVAVTVALIAFPEAGAKLVEKFSGIIDPFADKTASWRIKGWEAQLQKIAETNLFFGEGLGSYYSWKLGSQEITYSPHNAYVQMALKFGLLGLTIYLFLVIAFFRTTLLIRRKLPPSPVRAFLEMGIVCFGAAHGYMMGYGFEPVMLIFYGLACSAVKLCNVRSRVLRTT